MYVNMMDVFGSNFSGCLSQPLCEAESWWKPSLAALQQLLGWTCNSPTVRFLKKQFKKKHFWVKSFWIKMLIYGMSRFKNLNHHLLHFKAFCWDIHVVFHCMCMCTFPHPLSKSSVGWVDWGSRQAGVNIVPKYLCVSELISEDVSEAW